MYSISENALAALFSAYPDGRSGIALLVLRTTLGVALVMQGAGCWTGTTPANFRGLGAILSGALLTIGFLTPVIAALVACAAAGIEILAAPGCSLSLFTSGPSIVFAAVILVSVILLGPGAFSVDARLFGRREIIIPPAAPRR